MVGKFGNLLKDVNVLMDISSSDLNAKNQTNCDAKIYRMHIGIDLRIIVHVNLASVLLATNAFVKEFHLIIFVIDVLTSLIHNGNMVCANVKMDTLNMEGNASQILKLVMISKQTVALGHILIHRKRNVSLVQMDASVVKIVIFVKHVTSISDMTLFLNYAKKTVEMATSLYLNVMMEIMLMGMGVQLIVKSNLDTSVEVVVQVPQMAVSYTAQMR